MKNWFRDVLAACLAFHAVTATSKAGSDYYLKLWGCSGDSPTKASYQNQHFVLNTSTISFPKTGGCLTSSSSAKAAPGSVLHIAPCSPACAPETTSTVCPRVSAVSYRCESVPFPAGWGHDVFMSSALFDAAGEPWPRPAYVLVVYV